MLPAVELRAETAGEEREIERWDAVSSSSSGWRKSAMCVASSAGEWDAASADMTARTKGESPPSPASRRSPAAHVSD